MPNGISKTALISAVRTILERVEIAARGCNNTNGWDDPEDNLGAPDGLSYWDWIEAAEAEAVALMDSHDV